MDGKTPSDIPDVSGDEIAWLAAREREVHWIGGLHTFPDDDGMYVVEGRLPSDVTAVLIRAVDATEEELLRLAGSEADGSGNSSTEPLSHRVARPDPGRLRAYAFVLVVVRVVAAL